MSEEEKRKKQSFCNLRKKRIICHHIKKNASFMYKKTKGMILTFFSEFRCRTR